MEQSILNGTKKILGIDESYLAFDHDVITHINSAIGILNQIGIGSVGFGVEDKTATWDDLDLDDSMTGMVRTYIYLKVRMLFDPPTTSFLIQAMNEQIQEHEYRLSLARETVDHPTVEEVV